MLKTPLTRRALFLTGGATALTYALPRQLIRSVRADDILSLRAMPGNAYFVGAPYPATPVWTYNGKVPGPQVRLRQGERLRMVVDNALDQPTTVHWHGLRVPNNMDGVADLTQAPIQPGGSFTYEFDLPDAGTYWYHSHYNGSEQIGRGLYGPLIIEEQQPVAVDRELVWVLDDWRLTDQEEISDDFGQMHDMSHAGRLGNVATVNAISEPQISVRAGERLRIRIINAANARSFAFKFPDHQPYVIAMDGQPVAPHQPEDGYLTLGAAMRVDIILDAVHKPGSRFTLIDEFFQGREFNLLELVYSDAPALRNKPPDTPINLPANPLSEPDLNHAERYEITFAGGAMGGMREALLDGKMTDIRTLASHGVLWAINGVASKNPLQQPLLTLQQGQSYLLALRNDTAFPHPMHLHGHTFRVLTRDGNKTPYQPWHDTVLMMPGEQVDIAFVADNPGDWLFHCHILEHMMSGMNSLIRVTAAG